MTGWRRRTVVMGVAACAVGAVAAPVRALASEGQKGANPSEGADVVAQAFALMLGLIRQSERNAVRAARGLSYLAVALWEAQQAAGGQDERPQDYLAAVAARVLRHSFPRSDHAMLAAWSAKWTVGPASSPAHKAALAAADTVIVRSMGDGAQARWSPTMRPADFSGIWQPTFPMFAVVPLEGMAPHWQPWVPASPQRHTPPPAYRPGSPEHKAETQEVLDVARHLTVFQKERAQWWNLDSGSVTPPGVWLRVALKALSENAPEWPVDKRLRVLRDVCVAMHDAMIACWAVKLRDWSERPITSIRRELDPAFVPVLVTPGHPSYVSGHATVSAAAAVVLAAHWPAQAEAFWDMAAEAAMSRLWGGIHFRSDNEEGLRLGRAVGLEVVRAFAT